MSKTKEYGDFEKGIVVGMHLKDASPAKITEETGVSRSTQWRIRQNEDEDGYHAPESHVENRGRKSAIGYQNGRKIVQAATDDRSLTAADIFRDETLNVDQVSLRTVQRFLDSKDLKARHKRTRVKMTSDQAQERLIFCQDRKKWSKRQWQKMVYSDECFMRPTNIEIEFCRKKDDEDWLDERFIKQKQQSEMGIHIWAAISSEGLLGLEWLNPTIGETADSASYINTLQKFIFDDDRLKQGSAEGWTFVQDSATIHTSVQTREAIEASGISWIQLPPKSPDLNPIEHIWQYPKQAYFDSQKDFKGRGGRARLFVFITQILESAHVKKVIKKLYQTIPDKINDVIEHDGWWSRF